MPKGRAGNKENKVIWNMLGMDDDQTCSTWAKVSLVISKFYKHEIPKRCSNNRNAMKHYNLNGGPQVVSFLQTKTQKNKPQFPIALSSSLFLLKKESLLFPFYLCFSLQKAHHQIEVFPSLVWTNCQPKKKDKTPPKLSALSFPSTRFFPPFLCLFFSFFCSQPWPTP